MSPSTAPRLSRRVLSTVALAASSAGVPAAAHAQITAQVYSTWPSSQPAPSTPFAGGTLLCTAQLSAINFGFGANTGGAAFTTICPQLPSSQLGFGIRFTGFLDAPAIGSYSFTAGADDGWVFSVRRTSAASFTTVAASWADQGFFTTTGSVSLDQGNGNQFVFDYFANNAGQSAVRLDLPTNVRFSAGPQGPQTTIPEPTTVALLGGGLLGLGAVARRRRVG